MTVVIVNMVYWLFVLDSGEVLGVRVLMIEVSIWLDFMFFYEIDTEFELRKEM